jgi:hypothetical protein
MDSGINADGVIAFGEDTSFCDMIAFLIDIFGIRAFGTVPDKAESFKLAAIGLHDITVINMDHRLIGNPSADGVKIREQCAFGSAFVQVAGEPFHTVDLFGIFVKLIHDIREKAAAGGQHAIGDVGRKFSVGLGKTLGDFI